MNTPHPPQQDPLIEKATAGNLNAATFLHAWGAYWNDVLKLLTSGKRDAQEFIKLLAFANVVFSMPYYTQNASRLHLITIGACNILAESLKHIDTPEMFETNKDLLKHRLIIDVTLAVAMIEGGFTLVREISPMASPFQ